VRVCVCVCVCVCACVTGTAIRAALLPPDAFFSVAALAASSSPAYVAKCVTRSVPSILQALPSILQSLDDLT